MSTVIDPKSKYRGLRLSPDEEIEARRLADEAAARRMSISAAVREFTARFGRPIRRDTLMRRSSSGDARPAGVRERCESIRAIGNRGDVATQMPPGAAAALAALDLDEVDAIDDVPDKPDGSPGCCGREPHDPSPSAIARRAFVLASMRERHRPDAVPGRLPVDLRPTPARPAGRRYLSEN